MQNISNFLIFFQNFLIFVIITPMLNFFECHFKQNCYHEKLCIWLFVNEIITILEHLSREKIDVSGSFKTFFKIVRRRKMEKRRILQGKDGGLLNWITTALI